MVSLNTDGEAIKERHRIRLRRLNSPEKEPGITSGTFAVAAQCCFIGAFKSFHNFRPQEVCRNAATIPPKRARFPTCASTKPAAKVFARVVLLNSISQCVTVKNYLPHALA
jgi:hypothetical protein